jgi:uncharacterized protein (DUF433 family)
MNIQDIIHSDKDIQNGQVVFVGTRVPVVSLFDHLEAGISLDEFLDDFPSVTREQAVSLLEIANKLVTSAKAELLYEALAG